MTEKETIADILNNLITINKNRIVGYKEAMHDTNGSEKNIMRLFKEMVKQSESFIEELKERIKDIGAVITDKTITTGFIYNTWMDIIYSDAEAKPEIAHFCKQIEETAIQAYKAALMKMENLDKNIHNLILMQKQKLINSSEQIKKHTKE